MATLAWIRKARPRTGIIENVTGLDGPAAPGQLNPLQFITKELQSMEYFTLVMHLDLGELHQCTRRRTVMQLSLPFIRGGVQHC